LSFLTAISYVGAITAALTAAVAKSLHRVRFALVYLVLTVTGLVPPQIIAYYHRHRILGGEGDPQPGKRVKKAAQRAVGVTG
jgi:hypothetical protein